MKIFALLGALLSAVLLTSVAAAEVAQDPRIGLSPGLDNAGAAANGLELLAPPEQARRLLRSGEPGSFGFVNSDLSFQGDRAYVGNFNGFQIYDISIPTLRRSSPPSSARAGRARSRSTGTCSSCRSRSRAPGSTAGHRGPQAVGTRFQGVRIFDISNEAQPVQVAAVQTCRGSHTHTILKSPHDDANLYVYVNGTAGVRSPSSSRAATTTPATGEDPSRWRIEVIRVPLAAPQNAAVVNEVRLMGDPATGRSTVSRTRPDAAAPVRDPWGAVADHRRVPRHHRLPGARHRRRRLRGQRASDRHQRPGEPASGSTRCPIRTGPTGTGRRSRTTGRRWSSPTSGAAVLCRAAARRTSPTARAGARTRSTRSSNGQLEFRSYYKMPAEQTTTENCVSHLPSLIPVPGRDIIAQAWYQGGVSVIDFTDAANPKEIAFYDRGPISATALVLGGLWSTYYYNGAVYGSEIARGFDVWGLTPNDELSENEIAAAAEVQLERLTPQHQPQFTHAPSFNVVRSYRDQLERAGYIDANTLDRVDKFVARAEEFRAEGKDAAAKAQLNALAAGLPKTEEFDALRDALRALADS